MRQYDTQFQLKDNYDWSYKEIYIDPRTIYYIVGFPYNSNGEILFLLDSHTDVGKGSEYEGGLHFTGFESFVLTEEELKEGFKIVGSYEEKLKEMV